MQRLYHGFQFKNRNGTRREIDYKRGTICLVPKNNSYCWRLLIWSIWSRDPTTTGKEPGCTRKFMQSSYTTWKELYAILCPGYIKIFSTSAPISKYYPSKMFNKSSCKFLVNVHGGRLWLLTVRISLETANGKIYCNLPYKYLLFDSSDLHGERFYGW